MEAELAKKDMRVIIDKIDVTHRRHGSNPCMENIIGQVHRISSINKTDKGDHQISLRIAAADGGSYFWAPEDVSPLIIRIFKAEKFDPKNLII